MGKLHLHDNINDHLPFKIYNPNFPNKNITIQQLVNHTSSILDGESYERICSAPADHTQGVER